TDSYVVTQADVDGWGGGDGTIDNVATANGNSVAAGTAALEAQDEESIALCDDPAINIVKEGVSDDPDCTDAGDTITYTYTVTNTGNVALSGVVVVDDQLGNPDFVGGDTDGDGYLDVDETWIYTDSYVVTQADVDGWGGGDGTIDNVATANGNSVAAGTAALEAQDEESIALCDDPAINIVKEGVSDDPDCTDAGDTITYTYTVTNTGNVALSGVVVVDDQLGNPDFVGGDTDGDGYLDVDETWIYTDSYVVTQADVD
ncbi:hypothetical protein, partial [Qipengyuania aquimaris]|uniref:DUF7507 domain-containing protein n=1 Tax=Qipengyuania aquimaris TaxID=255984 RepID=UPI001CD45723